MTDAALRDLARRAGIHPEWVDYRAERRSVAPDILRRILGAMSLPADSPAQIAQSLHHLGDHAPGRTAQPLVTGDVGRPLTLPPGDTAGTRAELTLEDGRRQDVTLGQGDDGRTFVPAIADAGYHRLVRDGRETVLAVAPARCLGVEDLAPQGRAWGLTAQTYAIRRDGDGGIGDMGGVALLAEAAARHGADALALSPCHALFAAEPTRFGPYSPSSRLFLNVLHGDPAMVLGVDRVAAAVAAAGGEQIALEGLPLIDWPAAGVAKFRMLRALFDGMPELPDDFVAFRRAAGPSLEDHARFEAIHRQQVAGGGAWRWQDWPAALRDSTGPGVAAFADEHAREVTFHAFLQWIAQRSHAATQQRALAAGMRIGLVADMAVGMDGAGSHAWSRPGDVMTGLAVGAPPDLINGHGQNWGLTTFAPPALVTGGFAPFIATLRAAMQDSGGVRIDHVMGLARLWVVPDGAGAVEGAYITYPVDDLLRLVALESHRHRALVIGEDLGTVEPGFRQALDRRGLYGMRVLWFERQGDGFLPPGQWTSEAASMTTTHDLPSVSGWWRGEDIRLRAGVAGLDAGDPAELAERDHDRTRLWQAFVDSGAAGGPPPDTAEPVVDAAVRHVAGTRSNLMLLPVEDALALPDQPNLPGTIDEHPNWRRRLPAPADRVLDPPAVAERLEAVARIRARP